MNTMAKLVFPKSEDETEGAEIGGLIYLGLAGPEAGEDIPAALTGYVCPGLFSDPAAEGWMRFGDGPKKGVACFVIPAKKYEALSAFLPKTVVSVDELFGKYYVWFLMDRHPEGCSVCNEEVMLFWDGFAFVASTILHKWLPTRRRHWQR